MMWWCYPSFVSPLANAGSKPAEAPAAANFTFGQASAKPATGKMRLWSRPVFKLGSLL